MKCDVCGQHFGAKDTHETCGSCGGEFHISDCGKYYGDIDSGECDKCEDSRAQDFYEYMPGGL